MDSALIATWVTAISTVIYTAGTFMLWLTNKASVRALHDQLEVLQRQLEGQSAFNKVLSNGTILDAHREIWMTIIQNPNLASQLNEAPPKAENRTTSEFIGSILINHCARVHSNHLHGVAEEDKSNAFARDARYLFSFPLVAWRWSEVKKYHSPQFITFVNNNVLS